MRVSPGTFLAVRFTASLVAGAALLAPGLRAQSDYDSGLGRLPDFLRNGQFGSGFPNFDSRGAEPVPVPVYFPPDPPPLDQFRRTPGGTRTWSSVPSELAGFVNEAFYPELAALLSNHALSDRQRDALQRYRDDKRLLQHNLRTALGYILAQEPPARAPLFARLAQEQAAAIAELEKRADDLRSSFYKSDYAWDGARKPIITDKVPRSGATDDVVGVMRGGAFFHNGLSLPQRELLREIAIEVASAADSTSAAVAAQPWLFFSPNLSRVVLPPDLSASAAEKVAEYQSRKSALRKELYDAVYREDATWLDVTRTFRLKSLAEKQAPEFAALEILAEEIRRELPPLAPPAATRPLVSLSPYLLERITALYDRKSALLDDLNREFEKIRANDSLLRLLTAFNAARQRYELNQRFRFPGGAPKQLETAKAKVDALDAAYDRVDDALTVERNDIRREIAAHLQSEDPARIDLALADGVRRAMEQKVFDAMRDYRVAVFEPGLSPGQRRLLFDHAIEALDLPLPAGMMQPRQRLTKATASVER